ncbi:hypothetical protein ABPG72_019988 [Tetrahymena utriculariae]
MLKRKITISLSTVYKTVKKIKNGESLHRKERSDKRKTISLTNPDKKRINVFSSKNQGASVSVVKSKLKLSASKSTIWRYLKSDGYTIKKVEPQPPLTSIQKLQRVNFCKKHQNDDLTNAVFSDECSIETYLHPKMYWHKEGEQKYHTFKPKHPEKLHIWGAISLQGTIDLQIFKQNLTGKLYVDILKKTLLKWMKKQKNIDKINLYQDKDPKHTSSIAETFYKNNNIQWVRDWSPYSPDLNPIENIWAWLRNKVSHDNPINMQQLKKSVRKHWKQINSEFCSKYINSWSNRCQLVIQKYGVTINY